VVGDEKINCEMQKKELHQGRQEELPFSSFVKRYRTDDMYIVGSLPLALRKVRLRSYTCRSVRAHVSPQRLGLPRSFQRVMLHSTTPVWWMSSGGTKSKMHRCVRAGHAACTAHTDDGAATATTTLIV